MAEVERLKSENKLLRGLVKKNSHLPTSILFEEPEEISADLTTEEGTGSDGKKLVETKVEGGEENNSKSDSSKEETAEQLEKAERKDEGDSTSASEQQDRIGKLERELAELGDKIGEIIGKKRLETYKKLKAEFEAKLAELKKEECRVPQHKK